MRFNARHLYRYVLVGGALVALGCAPSGAWAQQNGNQDQTQAMAQGQAQGQFQARTDDWVAFDQFLDAHPDIANALKANPDLLEDQNFLGEHNDLKTFSDDHPRLRQDMDQDRTGFHHRFQFRHEVAAMDLFLDSHPFIDQRLEANPSLITDKTFVQDNTALQDFLNSNPQVRQAFDQNPTLFMKAEDRFEGTRGDLRGNLVIYNQFAKTNPDLAKQLQANPSLINDKAFVDAHVSLKAFLSEHPEVAQQIAQNPAAFFQMEARFENNPNNMGNPGDNGAGRGRNPNPDLTRTEIATTDQFLDQHPDIEKQLEANPSLINNQNFLQAHPQLQTFLNDHGTIREEFTENPNFFVNQLNRSENSPADRAADNGMNNNNRGNNPNPDLTRGEVASMDQFLDQNPKIEKQLEANPSLINSTKYLNSNPQLRAFLSAHPQVREEFTENPSFFMHQEGRFEATENNSSGVATMDAYLDKHPDVARDLNAYPARINDSDYLSHHKDLDNFLKKHPEVREQFSHNPSAFMHQESAFDASAQMDDFLDNHKNIRKDLDQNPESVKNDDYLDHHKDLKAFLAKNPGVGDQFQNNPGGFMDNERKFDADRQMDFYLTKHKDVAKDLQKDPDRVKDDKYLDHHKDLKQLMDKNPELAESARTNPTAFMQEQMKFHEQYKNQHIEEKTKVEERAKTHGAQ